MSRVPGVCVAAMVGYLVIGFSSAEAGIWPFRHSDECCENVCECPDCQYIYECERKKPKVKKEKKHCCCLIGDRPEVAPILRTIAARTTTDSAVRVTPDATPPKLVTQIQSQSGSGAGAQFDEDDSADGRIDGLEKEVEKMSILILDLSKQLKSLEERENGS